MLLVAAEAAYLVSIKEQVNKVNINLLMVEQQMLRELPIQYNNGKSLFNGSQVYSLTQY